MGVIMSHRNAVPEDFLGKTITAVDLRADNIWRFVFSDGTRLAIETEDHCMVVCDECAKPENTPPED